RPPHLAIPAPRISAAVTTGTISTPVGQVSAVGALIRITLAPRAFAAVAIAYPIRPLDRFPINLTGSIASLVPPAVTSTVSSAKSDPRAGFVAVAVREAPPP